jgi:hypothetical protein
LAINNSVIECTACDDAIGFLNYLLGSPFVEGSLKTLLTGLCQELPPAYSTGVRIFLNYFEIHQYIYSAPKLSTDRSIRLSSSSPTWTDKFAR